MTRHHHHLFLQYAAKPPTHPLFTLMGAGTPPWFRTQRPRPGKTAVRLDDTPCIAVISAFAPEPMLLPQVQQARQAQHQRRGVHHRHAEGKPVVVFLSASVRPTRPWNTQLVLDRFHVSHVVFSGIGGGVNPSLHIGDVTVPAQWGQYMEMADGARRPAWPIQRPAWMKSELTMPAFGMMHLRPVEVRSAAQPQLSKKFWFEADPEDVYRPQPAERGSEHRLAATCLKQRPQLVVGGNGVSGQAFVDNKAFREYAFKPSRPTCADMRNRRHRHGGIQQRRSLHRLPLAERLGRVVARRE